MRTLKRIGLFIISMIILLIAFGYVYLYVLPKGPEVTQVQTINTGSDSFVMYAYKESKKKSIRVWTYKPESWQNGDEVLFVMHGGGRNADDYLEAWKKIAEDKELLIIAPEFENKFAKYTTNDYQEGNLFTFFGTRNPKEKWAFTVIENIFDRIKVANGITNKTYDIFGHSAGGQFVHRMVMLMPDARIQTAIAANAGFYTFPNENQAFPYGLKKTPMKPNSDIADAFRKNLVILLGELDNNASLGTFRKTDLAMAQGTHRLERGTNFYNAVKELTLTRDLEFNWKIDTIMNVGHDFRKMSRYASEWLYPSKGNE